LEVNENADRASAFFLKCPDHFDLPAHLIVRGMAHVDAKKVGASMKQR
jgi:hypothetical protein